MPAASTTVLPQGLEVDEQALAFRFVRQLDATPRAVFNAWTRPEEISLWWDPEGDRLQVCEIDLRVGGGFKFVTRSHPDMPFLGVYREIEPTTRLVFEAMGAVGRVEIQEAGGGCRLAVEITCPSPAHFQNFAKAGVDQGTSRTLDNLVAYLRSKA